MRRRQPVKSAESITTRTGMRRIGAVVAIALAASAAGGATAQAGTDSWTPLAQPPQMVPSVTSISFGPGGVGYASGGERAFRTTDGGATWTVRSQSLGALTADPFDPQRVYAWRTHWPRERNGNPQLTRIGISTDGGTSFTEIDPHLPFTVEGDLEGRVDILPDPVHPGLLYMSIQQSSSCAFLRSSDHAATWTVLTTPWRTCRLAVDQAGQLYTGADGHGVMRSTDRGATWTSGSAGIPRKPNGDQPVGVTVVSAAHAGVAYTSAAKAVYRHHRQRRALVGDRRDVRPLLPAARRRPLARRCALGAQRVDAPDPQHERGSHLDRRRRRARRHVRAAPAGLRHVAYRSRAGRTADLLPVHRSPARSGSSAAPTTAPAGRRPSTGCSHPCRWAPWPSRPTTRA